MPSLAGGCAANSVEVVACNSGGRAFRKAELISTDSPCDATQGLVYKTRSFAAMLILKEEKYGRKEWNRMYS